MYTQPFEPGKKKKGGRFWRWLIFLIILSGGAYAAYAYGPRLYYRLTGDALLRIERRAAEIEAQLERVEESGGANGGIADILADLDDTRRIAEILERNSPELAEVHYYHGLLAFYELRLRVPLNGLTLLQLTGRGYLPLQRTFPGESIPEVSIPRLGNRISRRLRKALALDPDLSPQMLNGARLMISYGDLFFTGRTDPHLLDLLESVSDEELTPGMARFHDWAALALFAISGRSEAMQSAMERVDAAAARNAASAPTVEGPEPGTTAPPVDQRARLVLGEQVRNLILCHGNYYARDYLRALRLARQVKFDPEVPDILKVEAVRMEGEIFLVQRSPGAARYFFEEALRMSGGDEFIKERLDAVSAEP